MELSNRLQKVASFVSKGSRVADIGCDHGYVSIYLMENQIASKVIAMDINKGPLEKAKENIQSHNLVEYIDTRLSDGIKELSCNEVDSLVIAGMGGKLMVKILSDCKEKVLAMKELILQPQAEIFLVREYLYELGFFIRNEDMLVEDGKFYQIIYAIKNSDKVDKKELLPVENMYGPVLLSDKNPVLKEFLIHERGVFEDLIIQLEEKNQEKRLDELIQKKNMACHALLYFEETANEM